MPVYEKKIAAETFYVKVADNVAWVSKREERDANFASSTRKHLGYSKPVFLQCFPNVSLYAFLCNICRGHKTCVLKAFGFHNVIFAKNVTSFAMALNLQKPIPFRDTTYSATGSLNSQVNLKWLRLVQFVMSQSIPTGYTPPRATPGD